MMRVTVRGLLLGGSVGVLLTTVMLWSQCRPPLPKYAGAESLGQQRQRQPLQTHHQTTWSTREDSIRGDENYLEEDYISGGSKSPPPPPQHPSPSRREHKRLNQDDSTAPALSDIPCVINRESSVSCKRDETEVYIPFSFIHNYFEVYGQISSSNDGSGDIFEWSHSYSKVYEPETPYDPHGLFLNFKLYNVEARERVKCISGTEGVPISTQWSTSGYTYPIQIAQFGLAHYCKFLTEKAPSRTILEDGHEVLADWHVEAGSKISRSLDITLSSHVLHFRTSSKTGPTLKNTAPSDQLLLTVVLRLPRSSANTTLVAAVEIHDKRSEVFHIHYTRSSTLINAHDHNIYIGLGEIPGWRKITRNLLIDLQKGAVAAGLPRKIKKVNRSKVRLLSLELRGEGSLDNITLSTTEHLSHFFDAADWLVHHQDKRGGWSIPVPRKVVTGVLELEAGWYSAMAQGQAMSLLVRAAHHTGNQKYLKAAARATKLFYVNSTNGGVRTYFPGDYVWYEEYPTTPSLFVLNGFIYSLLGLYDLSVVRLAPKNTAKELFQVGMQSLKKLLPLFDTGWGSFYDLRHFTTHGSPNIARWDYHTTHITQLLLLSSLDDDPLFEATVRRWQDYMVGKRASHN